MTPGAIVGRHLSELDGAWNLAALQDRIRPRRARESGFERVPIELDGDGRTRTGRSG